MARREEGEYREYATDEQRRQAGCIAGRMQTNFGDATLGLGARARLRREPLPDNEIVRDVVLVDVPDVLHGLPANVTCDDDLDVPEPFVLVDVAVRQEQPALQPFGKRLELIS